MTGLKVTHVNVHVQGIKFPEEKIAEEEATTEEEPTE